MVSYEAVSDLIWVFKQFFENMVAVIANASSLHANNIRSQQMLFVLQGVSLMIMKKVNYNSQAINMRQVFLLQICSFI